MTDRTEPQATGSTSTGSTSMALDWTHYREEVYRTVPPALRLLPERMLTTGALGLCGEAGEVADHIKKWLAQGHDLDPDKLRDELGDVLWYWTLLVAELGYTAEEIMLGNREKLRARYAHGFDPARSRNREKGD